MVKISLIEPVGGYGGMDYYDYGLALGLGQNNVQVDYYTSSYTKIREIENVRTIPIFSDFWSKNTFKKLFLFLFYYYQSIKISKESGARLIHLHFFSFNPQNFLILCLGKIKKLKIVVTIHDVESFSKNIFQFFEKISYPIIDGVIVHNNTSYNEVVKKDIDKNKIHIIPHGNYIPFVSINETRKINKNNSLLNLLFFGQIKEVKGLDVLLNALGILKPKGINSFKLTIAGKVWKNDFTIYQKLISQNEIEDNVILDIRYIPDEEVSDFFERADLVVLPYKRIYQSGVLLNSMSFKKAVLVSDLEPFKEIINDNENGFVFNSENPSSLADKLIEISDDKDVIEKVASNAYLYVEKYHDWKTIG